MNLENKIPKIRKEILYQIFKVEGNEFIKLFDSEKYTEKQPMFPLFIMEILQLANEDVTFLELKDILEKNFANFAEDVFNNVVDIITALDDYGFLQTENFENLKKEREEYLKNPIRMSVCQGSSFSEIKEEAEIEIDNILNSDNETVFDGNAKAIIIPHIDFRISEWHKLYSKAINSIKNTKSNLFVILGTAHYGNTDYFMFCDKHFETPLGRVETDLDLLEAIKAKYPKLTIDNIAHKEEHSIEYQVILLQKAIKHKFKILPILVGSFYEHIIENKNPESDKDYIKQVNAIKEVINEKYPEAVFLASGDFAHFGKRFSDDFPAREQLSLVRFEDEKLIKALEERNYFSFFKQIQDSKDERKICGTSPFYSLLKIAEPTESKFLDYGQWDDFMTESAVTFASIAYK